MKKYESIPYYQNYIGLDIIAFDKIDGSNLRFEWSRKRGFYKFGTRNMMIDRSHETFGFAIDLFINKYSEEIDKILRGNKYKNFLSAVFFAELHGSKSAFGQHEFGNDVFDITIFDVDLYKKGIVGPKEFIEYFGHIGIPKVIYQGTLDQDFVSSVKSNQFNLSEGVIAKGTKKVKNGGNELPFSCKIKTDDWLERLKNKDPYLYEEEIKDSRA